MFELTCELCVHHKPSSDQHQKACQASVKERECFCRWVITSDCNYNHHHTSTGIIIRDGNNSSAVDSDESYIGFKKQTKKESL